MPMDRSKYPYDWEQISKRIRFDRAENHCEWCGAENYKAHPITGSRVVLTVAHINHDTTDNRDENLAALCQRCHLNHDKDLHRATRFANERKRQENAGQLSLWDTER